MSAVFAIGEGDLYLYLISLPKPNMERNQILNVGTSSHFSLFCLDGRVFFPVNRGLLHHSPAASSPLVSVLGIIDEQASHLHILFDHFIP